MTINYKYLHDYLPEPHNREFLELFKSIRRSAKNIGGVYKRADDGARALTRKLQNDGARQTGPDTVSCRSVKNGHSYEIELRVDASSGSCSARVSQRLLDGKSV